MASVKYGAAAKRHFDDAECLFAQGGRHLAGADHLYGVAVECALKRNLQLCGLLTLRPDGKPEPMELGGKSGHCPNIWGQYVFYMEGRTLPPIDRNNPFTGWSISDRYTDGEHLVKIMVEKHRSAAVDVMQSADRL